MAQFLSWSKKRKNSNVVSYMYGPYIILVLAKTFSVKKKNQVDQKCITVYQIYDEKYV